MVNNLRDALVIDLPAGTHEATDPDDGWLLNLADFGRADFLITGDKRSGLLAHGRIGTATIMGATAFSERICA